MDIYYLINSKDIREYLRKIEYKFSTIEAAFLVYVCEHITLEEKIEAWNIIIDTMPDCAMEGTCFRRSIGSIHNFLKAYIALQKKKLEIFYDSKDDAIYNYEISNCIHRPTFFHDYSSCRKHLVKNKIVIERMNSNCENMCPKKIFTITKSWMGFECKSIYVNMNKKLQVMEIGSEHNTKQIMFGGDDNDILLPEEFELDDTFDMMYFPFPTPFQRGDVLRCYWGNNGSFKDNLYVLDSLNIDDINNDNILDYWSSVYGFRGDEIILDTNFEVYLNMEKVEIASTVYGKQRVIKALSDLIKERIIVDEFVEQYNEYLKEASSIKKVNICSREMTEKLFLNGFPKNTAIISFYDPLEEYLHYKGKVDNIYHVPVQNIDYDELEEYELTMDIVFPDAQELAKFIYDAYEKGKKIVCQCEYGESRSAGCAAAILEHFEHRGITVFNDYRYYPNKLIYKKLLYALETEKERRKIY